MIKRILIITAAAIFVVLLLLFAIGAYRVSRDINENEVMPEASKVKVTPMLTKDIRTASPVPTITATIVPTIEPVNKATPKANDKSIATITIITDRKTRTYDIMPDVSVKTLKRNIGHLPSSAMFGKEGLCVLMGHRDTDFSILQYVKVGDEIRINSGDGSYIYIVTDLEILNSDSELRFNAVQERCLVLVTCYPFRYTGHAPRKYLIYAEIKGT